MSRLWSACRSLVRAGNKIDVTEQDVSRLIDEGVAIEKEGRLEDAMRHYSAAIRLAPNFARAHLNRGNILLKMGNMGGAVEAFKTAIKHNPNYAGAFYNLGIALKGTEQLDEAVTYFRRAVEINPDYAEAHNNLGNTLSSLSRLDDAVASYCRAVEINPDYAEAHNNLGVTLRNLGQLDASVVSLHRALEIKPDFAEAHFNLGNTLMDLGHLNEAHARFRHALEIKPDFPDAHSNLIFLLDLIVGTDTVRQQDERKLWGKTHATPFIKQNSHPNTPTPERRLRVGYVSGDFREHSAAHVFGAMLINFDRSQFDVVAYSNTANEDVVSRLFQQSVTNWRNIFRMSDDAVADLIRQDEIDILVDLSGHSRGNRLLVFARKPAPIQITAWGYVGGTGIKAMDVFFADSVIVPPDEKPLYAEEVRYLPNVVSAFFPHVFPPVNTLPALSASGITFGSFNRLVKVSDEAYQAWAQVLLAVPNSRMELKTGELIDASTRDRVVGHFAKAGVAPERITLLGKTSWVDHALAFNQIDIALDPFPHGGGVTTLEGLMMGVPVVTLRWPTLVGRLSASILTTLGLTDWIAETTEQYIEIAKQKAEDISALAELRQQMRSRFNSSVIGNAGAYVMAVEQEYRVVWRRWCGSKQPDATIATK